MKHYTAQDNNLASQQLWSTIQHRTIIFVLSLWMGSMLGVRDSCNSYSINNTTVMVTVRWLLWLGHRNTFNTVTSLTKMVRHYWSKLSHVLLAIIRYLTGRHCLHWHDPMWQWHWIMSHRDNERKQIRRVLIGWGAAVGVASYSWRDVIMSWRIVSFRASENVSFWYCLIEF